MSGERVITLNLTFSMANNTLMLHERLWMRRNKSYGLFERWR